jgi:hypothetical protein
VIVQSGRLQKSCSLVAGSRDLPQDRADREHQHSVVGEHGFFSWETCFFHHGERLVGEARHRRHRVALETPSAETPG